MQHNTLNTHYSSFHSDSKGEVQPEIYNKNGNPQFKFFYYDDKSVVESMKQAKELLPVHTNRGNEL